ncbi:hypothetical protein [Paraglaciecola sp.]|uniref:hypothetical protein n=1 Tax=Paraglaciecola sp. TaxID=1920173 RepID=UPI003EFA906F
MKFKSIIFALPLILNSNVFAKNLVNIDDFPQWFKDSVQRSIEIEQTSKIKIKPFNVNSEMLGDAKLISDEEGTWYYQVDIGTASPVECYVFSEFDGTSNSLYSVVDYSLSGVETLNKKSLSGKFNYAIDGGVIENTPYMLLDTLYTLGEGDEKISGIIKAVSAQTSDSLQMCLHNETGYSKAFFRVFESFVKAFLVNEEKPEFFEVVYQMTLNEMPIGFAREQYVVDAEGDISIKQTSAMLVPVDASSVSRSDDASTSWGRADGSLINGTKYTIENGVMSSNFSISSKEGKWHVEGELQGKAVTKTLIHDTWLQSDYGYYIDSKSLLESQDKSKEFHMWLPEADPTSAIKVVMTKIENDPKANLEFDMGPLKLKSLSDKNGVLKRGVVQQGALEIQMKSVFVKGLPRLQ